MAITTLHRFKWTVRGADSSGVVSRSRVRFLKLGPRDDGGLRLWPFTTAIAVAAIAWSVSYLVPTIRNQSARRTASRALKAANFKISEDGKQEAQNALAVYGAAVLVPRLKTLTAAVPRGATIRMIAVTDLPEINATVAEGAHARTYSSADPSGFPRGATAALRNAAPVRLAEIDPAAPARMIAAMVRDTERTYGAWSSLELVARRDGRPSYWRAVWTDNSPAVFVADVHGRHLRLVSGSRR